MNKSIKEIQQEITNLERLRSELEDKLSQAVISALESVAQEHPMHRISKHCYIINYSDLIGNPWNFEFYDWEASVKVCLDYLKDKSPTSWIESLNKKLHEKDTGPVEFTRIKYCCGIKSTIKIPVSRVFLEKVIEELK